MNQAPKTTIQKLCRQIEVGGLGSLTEAERQLFAVNWLFIESNIGGFHQFFFNDAGKFAADAVAGLHRFGASELATIFQTAVDLFPAKQVPVDIAERRVALADLPPEVQWEYMSELTAQFFRTAENVWQGANDYIATNEELFPALQSK